MVSPYSRPQEQHSLLTARPYAFCLSQPASQPAARQRDDGAAATSPTHTGSSTIIVVVAGRGGHKHTTTNYVAAQPVIATESCSYCRRGLRGSFSHVVAAGGGGDDRLLLLLLIVVAQGSLNKLPRPPMRTRPSCPRTSPPSSARQGDCPSTDSSAASPSLLLLPKPKNETSGGKNGTNSSSSSGSAPKSHHLSPEGKIVY